MESRGRFRFRFCFILAVMGTTAAAYLFSESASSQRSEAESTSQVKPRYSWHAALDVVPHVSVTVRKDHETGHWIYSYTLTNDSTSANVITKFALDPVEEAISIAGIEHWYHKHGFGNRRHAAVWAVVDVGPTPTDWDSVSLYPSVFDIQPGQVVDGFNIISRRPPGLINYYVQGFHDIASWEEPDQPRLFDNAVSGPILGPGGEPAESSPRQWFSSSRSRPLPADSVRSPKQAVDIIVSAGVSMDSASGVYSYSYSILNEPSSGNVLSRFGMRQLVRPIRINSPEGWSGWYGYQDDPNALVWVVTETGPAPPGWGGDQVYIGPFHVEPGDTVAGFTITAREPPSNMIKFYAQGFDSFPRSAHQDVPILGKLLWNECVTGPTLGPASTTSEEK